MREDGESYQQIADQPGRSVSDVYRVARGRSAAPLLTPMAPQV
jgi:hypothetical protein